MSQNINKMVQEDSLVKLVKNGEFIGSIYSINYSEALVLTNDMWIEEASGIPHNSFLVASSFDPENYINASGVDKKVVLLRVIGSKDLPQEKDLIQTKIDNLLEQIDINYDLEKDFDSITKGILQSGGLKCSILGTFFKRNNELILGSDLESFFNLSNLKVFKPSNKALEKIVNHINPIKRKKLEQDAKKRGFEETPEPIKLGTVRYTSTDYMHRPEDSEKVSFSIQPSDFLGRRTAVFGMTRTGKSNTIKHTVSTIKRVAEEGNLKIGQLIYDLNGEYANTNVQDEGALSNVFKDTVCYRLYSEEKSEFKGLLNNFFENLNEGYSIIKKIVSNSYSGSQPDTRNFLQMSLDEPPKGNYSQHNRWLVKQAAYKTLLYKAGFQPPNNYIRFKVGKDVVSQVNEKAEEDGIMLKDPNDGVKYSEAYKWFNYALNIADDNDDELLSSSGNEWFDDETISIVRMLCQQNSSGSYISGYTLLTEVSKYHNPERDVEVGKEIYNHLENGKIVILDLSFGDPELISEVSEKIAKDILNKSSNKFIKDQTPPSIVIYIEEAHNSISKKDDLTDIWPRIAKEGAKFQISLVYSTQEVSSIHPNILANTENWFVSHINNKDELKTLTKFYDFEDFSQSLLRADDVGFSRIKTLSSPFVVPVQIDKFDPNK